jgi:hypothetical protein
MSSYSYTKVIKKTPQYIITKSQLIYLQENDKEYIFINKLLLNFVHHNSDGNLTFENNMFKKCGSRKIEIIFNISYKWLNAEYAPRYNFNILKNNIIYHSIYKGSDDNNYTANILQLTVIIDINESDKITFEFEKTDTDSNNFVILDNSHYKIRTF